ncbi:MAG TPA: transposase, partial [Anaerolineales bacterium]
DWESHRLTDAQWLLLQETFVSLHVELDSSRKYHRRKPLPADRILFEGILWKLAGGLRWQDLPDNYPVRLCQDLYSALYRTGYLQAIYKQLHWYLNVYGEAALDELVARGCFVIAGNRVQLSPSEDLTWEKYTALFLLQQGFHARRAIQREADLERRRRGIFYRLPAIRRIVRQGQVRDFRQARSYLSEYADDCPVTSGARWAALVACGKKRVEFLFCEHPA